MAQNNTATESVSISIPGWLLQELDRARDLKFRSRSDFVCEAIRKHILSLQDDPKFWETLCQKEKKESC